MTKQCQYCKGRYRIQESDANSRLLFCCKHCETGWITNTADIRAQIEDHMKNRTTLNLGHLRQVNQERAKEWLGYSPNLGGVMFHAVELAGETGEALNIIKKQGRTGKGALSLEEARPQLAKELADIIICTDLLAQAYGIDLSRATIDKFNETSEKYGFKHRLQEDYYLESHECCRETRLQERKQEIPDTTPPFEKNPVEPQKEHSQQNTDPTIITIGSKTMHSCGHCPAHDTEDLCFDRVRRECLFGAYMFVSELEEKWTIPDNCPLKEMVDDVEEKQELFNQQHIRTLQADVAYMREKNTNKYPDLGTLIQWLVEKGNIVPKLESQSGNEKA